MNRLTLGGKLNVLMFLNALVVLIIVSAGISIVIVREQFHEKGQQALHIANLVAEMPQIIEAFDTANPAKTIDPIAERIRTEMGAEFIVVGNMQLIRYSYPDSAQIGKPMDQGDNDNAKVLQGVTTITEARGNLGMSIRAKYPIFNKSNRQIGIVSVGFLVSDIWKQVTIMILDVVGLCAAGLLVSLAGAHLLVRHVRKQILNMEPLEIAYLVKEQAAILESISEGILAVDRDGRIVACNVEAQRLLDLENMLVKGRYFKELIFHPRLTALIASGPNYTAQPIVMRESLLVVIRVPILLGEDVVGSVLTFRDKVQLDKMEMRLKDIDRYTDQLRSQRHEFMNRLHTIAGLIEMQEYDLIPEFIDQINREQHQVLSFFANRIRDPAVLGLLVGKIYSAREAGVQLAVDEDSDLSESCTHRELIITVLGNAIDNAMEAISLSRARTPDPKVTVLIAERKDKLYLSVIDNGPGIPADLRAKVFEDGVTTKGAGRGLGLSLCKQLVTSVNGQLRIQSTDEGTALEMEIPREVMTYAQ